MIRVLPLGLIFHFIKQELVAIGELRLTHFNEFDLAEVKHEINVLKYVNKCHFNGLLRTCFFGLTD